MVRVRRRLFMGLLAASATLYFWIPAARAQGGPVSFGIVNVELMLRTAKAALKLRQDLDTQLRDYGARRTRAEKELGAAGQALGRQRTVLSAEAFDQKRSQLRQRAADTRRAMPYNGPQARALFQRAYQQALAPLRVAAQKIVKELSQAQNLQFVFRSTALVTSQGGVDLTPELIKRLDARLPSVAAPKVINTKDR